MQACSGGPGFWEWGPGSHSSVGAIRQVTTPALVTLSRISCELCFLVCVRLCAQRCPTLCEPLD